MTVDYKLAGRFGVGGGSLDSLYRGTRNDLSPSCNLWG